MNQHWIDKGFRQLGNEIYVYNNFLSKQEIHEYLSIIEYFVEKKMWDQDLNDESLKEKVTKFIPELQNIRKKMINLFEPEYQVSGNGRVTVLQTGDFRYKHSDVDDFIEKRKISANLTENDEFIWIRNIKYGTIVYFNEFEGGDLFYTNQNNLLYHPNPGDLVVHSAEEFCMHGVSKVIKGPRYGLSGFLSQPMKFPKNIN